MPGDTGDSGSKVKSHSGSGEGYGVWRNRFVLLRGSSDSTKKASEHKRHRPMDGRLSCDEDHGLDGCIPGNRCRNPAGAAVPFTGRNESIIKIMESVEKLCHDESLELGGV